MPESHEPPHYFKLAPEGTDGDGVDAVFEGELGRAGMEYRTCLEPVAHLVAQPDKVPGMVSAGRTMGLDFDADDSPGAEVGNEVNLVPTVAVTQVVELGSNRVHDSLGT